MNNSFREIPFSPPDITDLEINEVIKVLKSGWITTGPKTKEFEKKVAQYCTTPKAVCLNSATSCLELTLRILGVGPGDEVITSAYTYTASASVICHVGAKPVLVDTAKDSYQMDYDLLGDAITEKTKVIIPVDIAGVPCDYNRIFSIVNEKKHLFQPSGYYQNIFGRIVVLADAAHSFGAEYKNAKMGSVADFTSFSFHAVKNLTTAEGGAVTWKQNKDIDNEKLYRQYMLLSLHGQSKDAFSKSRPGTWEYDIVSPAYKCNMTDIMAAIGIAQLKRYDDLLQKRKRIIELYNDGLQNLNIQILSHYTDEYSSSGHLYLVRLLGKDIKYRNEMIKKLAELGISTNVHYKPLPMMTAYKRLGFDIKDFPNAFRQFENEITLPLHTRLTDNDVKYVVRMFFRVRQEEQDANHI